MKFTELLEKWMDARKRYKESHSNDYHYDYPQSSECYDIMIAYQRQIDDVIEELQAPLRDH